ncbi:unnamed protein product [Adineta steineri]|uniref:Uncharacterized protein n=1 Tax=Adineta steineri TaxID=433720 RepID=A0A819BA75_9BILA|nr:unnamed protein product [Adineta steineri]CAF1460911.1 unnamed protein product [Adineta steineri]CAF3528694.1 unnamed protein product [Adineta steineri]CAF3797563.1 unnamed protein product [Adineta steineri]
MNTTIFIAGILSCFLLMLSVAHSFALSGKENNNEDHLLVHRPYAISPNKYPSIYQDEGSMVDNSDEDDDHELEKRRFNAWAGKRNIISKRRFNAWAGRR